MRHHRRRLVIRVSSWCVEGMICAGVGIDFNLGTSGKRLRDLITGFPRYKLIEFRKVHHHRAGDLVGEIKICLDPDTVITDRCIDAAVGGSEVTEFTSKAKANCADFPLAGIVRLQG